MRKTIVGLAVLASVSLAARPAAAQTDSLYFPGTYCIPGLSGTCLSFFKLVLNSTFNGGTGMWDNAFQLSGSYTADPGVEHLLVGFKGPGFFGTSPITFFTTATIFQTAISGTPIDNGSPFDFSHVASAPFNITSLSGARIIAHQYVDGVHQYPDPECNLTGFSAPDCSYTAGGVVPEPSTWVLLATGLIGMAWLGRRRQLHLVPFTGVVAPN